MSIFGQSQFTKGVNRRTPIERTSPDSFYKLKNCRVNKRGDTGFISPIEGIETVATLSDYNLEYIFDSCVYGNFYIIVGRKTDGNLWVNIFDKSGNVVSSVAEFEVDSTPNDCNSAKLTILDKNILISPYNKYLVYDTEWYISDFVSTTPIVTVPEYTSENYARGEIDLSGVGISFPYTAELEIQQWFGEGKGSRGVTEIIQSDTYTNATELADAISNAINVYTDYYSTVTTDIAPTGINLSSEYEISLLDSHTGEVFVVETTAAPYATYTDLCTEIASKFTANFPSTFQLTSSGSELTFESLLAGNQYYNTGLYISSLTVPSEYVEILLPKVSDQEIFTEFLSKYTVSSDTGVLTLVSKIPGSEYEKASIIIADGTTYICSLSADYTAPSTGNLKSNTEYWYAARYKYIDGHKTRLSVPVKFDTKGVTTKAALTITTDDNYDGTIADIEVYRKENDSEWFLIDTIKTIDTGLSTIEYIDAGETDKQPLTVNEYIWDKTHETQLVLRDRVVRGNLYFNEKRLNLEAGWFSVSISDDISYGSVPINSQVDVYVKPRFVDGTDGFHQKVGKTLSIDEYPKSINIQQTAVINDDNIQQLSYYLKYTNLPVTGGIEFSSFELMNKNIPSIATHDLSTTEQDKPTTPKIFLGFRYIVCIEPSTYESSIPAGLYAWCGSRDAGWGRTNQESQSYFVSEDDRLHGIFYKISEGLVKTDRIDVDYYGKSLPYKLISSSNSATNSNGAKEFFVYSIYELAFYDGLEKSVNSGTVYATLNSLSVANGSNYIKNTDVIGSKIKVVGIDDKSANYDINRNTGFYTNTVDRNNWTNKVYGYESPNVAADSRVYLLLDSESIISEFTNLDINKNTLKMPLNGEDEYTNPYSLYESRLNLPATMSWELSGVELTENYTKSVVEEFTYKSDNNNQAAYTRFTYPNLKLVAKSNVVDSSNVVFVGSTLNEVGTVNYKTTGYTINDSDGYVYWGLKKSNIHETLIDETDIKQFTTRYFNQLIWSDPYVPSSYASEFRLFRYENFLNIPSDYGGIVAMESVNGRLYVFCDRAVRQVNIGEVLTQQSSGGQLIVNSTTFLNDGFWVLQNLQSVKPKSVKVYGNFIIFGDGLDIWLLGDGLKNISDGKITLDSTKSWVGVIDPKYKEYIVTDGTNTWAYSFELGEWFGSHGYSYLTGADHGVDLYGVISSNVVKHNSGYLDTDEYGEVEVEGVAYFADPNITTTWRKFYVEASPDNETVTSNPYTYNSVDVPDNFDQAEFSYSSVYGYWTPKDLYAYTTPYGTHPKSGVVKKNGLFHIGIAPMPYEDLDILLTDGTNTLGLSQVSPTDHLKLTEDTIINKNARYMYWRIKHKNINPALVIKSVKFEGLPKGRM